MPYDTNSIEDLLRKHTRISGPGKVEIKLSTFNIAVDEQIGFAMIVSDHSRNHVGSIVGNATVFDPVARAILAIPRFNIMLITSSELVAKVSGDRAFIDLHIRK